MRSYDALFMKQYEWKEVGNITTAKSALTTDKSAATINALSAAQTIIITPDDGTVALELRFRGEANGKVDVFNLYAMRGDSDHYDLIATISNVCGTQTDGTYFFADTIVLSAEQWIDDIVAVSNATNGIAKVILNTHGYKNFLLIATTLGSAAAYVDAARI